MNYIDYYKKLNSVWICCQSSQEILNDSREQAGLGGYKVMHIARHATQTNLNEFDLFIMLKKGVYSFQKMLFT